MRYRRENKVQRQRAVVGEIWWQNLLLLSARGQMVGLWQTSDKAISQESLPQTATMRTLDLHVAQSCLAVLGPAWLRGALLLPLPMGER